MRHNTNGSALATANGGYLNVTNNNQNGQLTLREKAEIAFKSGFYTDLTTEAQALMKLLVADDLGIPVTVALQGVHIIKGKPVIGSNLMASMIQSSGRYRYKIVKHDTQVCELKLYAKYDNQWDELGTERFTFSDAEAAGLTNSKMFTYNAGRQNEERVETNNWLKYPKNMLFARAISNAIRFYFPDLFMGNPVYTPEEMGATIDEDGNVISLESEKETRPYEKLKKIEVEVIKSEVAESPTATTRRAKKQKEVLEEPVIAEEQSESNTESQTKDEPKAPTRKELFAQIKTLMDIPELDLTQEKCRVMFKESYGCDINAAEIEQIQEFLDTITPF